MTPLACIAGMTAEIAGGHEQLRSWLDATGCRHERLAEESN